MIKLNYKNTDAMVIGQENGLDIEQEFNNYQDTISTIITDLNKRKDKPGQWLQWMNLGYNEETVWYVKEFASMVEGRFDNVLVLGIGGEMQQFLAGQTQDITEYNEQLVRRLIEKITVYDEKVIVEFKSGTSVDIHR